MHLIDTWTHRRSIFGAVILASGAPTAWALPPAKVIGDYVVNADVGSPTMQITGTGLYAQSRTGIDGSVASSTLTVGSTPAPSLIYTSMISSPGVNPASTATLAQGEATGIFPFLTYSLEILGPTGSVPIQVAALVQASLSPLAVGSYAYEVDASMVVYNGSSPSFGDYVSITGRSGYTVNSAGLNTSLVYDPSRGISGSVTDSHIWMAQTNVVYTVALDLFADMSISGLQGGGTMSESALIDPTFQISSTATNPGLYSVIVSDGVGNSTVAAVPEPETYAMMLAGLGLIGIGSFWPRLLRKRKGGMSRPIAA